MAETYIVGDKTARTMGIETNQKRKHKLEVGQNDGGEIAETQPRPQLLKRANDKKRAMAKPIQDKVLEIMPFHVNQGVQKFAIFGNE